MMMPMVMAALCSWSSGESTLRCLMVSGTTAAAAAGVVVITAVVGDVVAAAAAIGAASVVVLFALCWFWSLKSYTLRFYVPMVTCLLQCYGKCYELFSQKFTHLFTLANFSESAPTVA